MRTRKVCIWLFIIGFLVVCGAGWAIEKTPTGFYWPTGSSTSKLGPGFLATPPVYKTGLYHLGQDISASVGSAIYAVADGTIHHISTDGWGEGNVALVIQHKLSDGSIFYAVYGHIRNVNKDQVKAGQQIGAVGPYPEGGNHLHFGIYPGSQAPTAPLGLSKLPTGWKPGQPLDPKGFVDPIVWITTKRPAQQQNFQPTPPAPIIDNLQGEWIPGTIHVHTTFSDGSDNIPQRVSRAKKEGCRFIIITDHYKQIDNLDKPAYKYGAGTDCGFEDYFRNCQEQTSQEFVTIAGTEIESIWKPEATGEQSAGSHLLALRIKPEHHSGWKINPEIEKVQGQMDTQPAIVKKVRGLGWIPVAAHPNLIATKSAQLRFWEWRDSRFDFRVQTTLEMLQGIEMFNVETAKQQQDLVENYLGWLREGRSFFVTSACDSHNWVDAAELLLKTPHQLLVGISLETLRKYLKDADDDQWTRKTWIFVDNFSEEGILRAIEAGHTYAAKWGASLENLNYIPGFSFQLIDRPKFQFTIAFSQATTSSKTIRIYRDGLHCFSKDFPAGLLRMLISWEDNEVDTGKHFYVIEVSEALITSPIILNIQKPPIIPVIPKALDLVLVIDHTTSMGDDIAKAKRQACDIVHEVSKSIPNFRIALVTYGDRDDSPKHVDYISFTSDSNSSFNAINSIELRGGGMDMPEDVFDGLETAIKADFLRGGWRDDALHVVLLIGDAPQKRDQALMLTRIANEASANKVFGFCIVADNNTEGTRECFEAVSRAMRGTLMDGNQLDKIVEAILTSYRLSLMSEKITPMGLPK